MQFLVTDVDGEAEEGEEVCTEDGHEDICYKKLPCVSLSIVVYWEFLVAICRDGRSALRTGIFCGLLAPGVWG